MKIKKEQNGYRLWLSANDTYKWAHKADKSWPGSTLSGHRFYAAVDGNGLWDFTLDGKALTGDSAVKIDSQELEACIADHIPADLKKYWPCWADLSLSI